MENPNIIHSQILTADNEIQYLLMDIIPIQGSCRRDNVHVSAFLSRHAFISVSFCEYKCIHFCAVLFQKRNSPIQRRPRGVLIGVAVMAVHRRCLLPRFR